MRRDALVAVDIRCVDFAFLLELGGYIAGGFKFVAGVHDDMKLALGAFEVGDNEGWGDDGNICYVPGVQCFNM